MTETNNKITMDKQHVDKSTVQKVISIMGYIFKRLPLKLILIVALIIILFPIAEWGYKTVRNVFAWRKIENATLSILKNENISFLVTDKVVSQIVVEISENNPLLGQREGILIGTVAMYYGVDLKELNKSCLSRVGEKLIVHLPPPKELDFSVDPVSLKYITKRSGLNVLTDYVMNKNLESELRIKMRPYAEKFFVEHNMLPTREKIDKQLNELSVALSKDLGVVIEFR